MTTSADESGSAPRPNRKNPMLSGTVTAELDQRVRDVAAIHKVPVAHIMDDGLRLSLGMGPPPGGWRTPLHGRQSSMGDAYIGDGLTVPTGTTISMAAPGGGPAPIIFAGSKKGRGGDPAGDMIREALAIALGMPSSTGIESLMARVQEVATMAKTKASTAQLHADLAEALGVDHDTSDAELVRLAKEQRHPLSRARIALALGLQPTADVSEEGLAKLIEAFHKTQPPPVSPKAAQGPLADAVRKAAGEPPAPPPRTSGPPPGVSPGERYIEPEDGAAVPDTASQAASRRRR